jgi:hypothetical protein
MPQIFCARFRRIGCIRSPSRLIYGAAAIATEMVERKTLLAVLLIVALASAVVYTAGRLSTPEERVTTTTLRATTTVVSTVSETRTMTRLVNTSEGQSIPGLLRDKGFISIEGVGYFEYVRFEMIYPGEPAEPETILRNVTFTYLDKGIIIGPVCYYFNITFPDDSSEEMAGCSYPLNFATTIQISDHHNPKAGLLTLQVGQAVYLLVETS